MTIHGERAKETFSKITQLMHGDMNRKLQGMFRKPFLINEYRPPGCIGTLEVYWDTGGESGDRSRARRQNVSPGLNPNTSTVPIHSSTLVDGTKEYGFRGILSTIDSAPFYAIV